jgi:leucyl-tRNA synthetase
MSDELRILLSASLNVGRSIGDLNMAIDAISKHPSLKKINLKIDIDQSFTQSINKFISSVEKMKAISDDQNKTIQETQDVFKKLDGTITTVTQKVLANGEVIQKTKTIHDDNRKAMQDETVAAQKLADTVERQNKADLDAITK